MKQASCQLLWRICASVEVSGSDKRFLICFLYNKLTSLLLTRVLMSALESALAPIVKDDHIVRVCLFISTSYTSVYLQPPSICLVCQKSIKCAILQHTHEYTLQSLQPLLLYAMLVVVMSQSNGFVDSCTNT